MSSFPPPNPPADLPQYQQQQPIPVAALAWEPPMPPPPPMRRGRPGILTAMGVLSVVVACFSGLANLWLAIMAFGMYVASNAPVPPPPSTRPASVGSSMGTAIVGGIAIDPSQSEDGLTDPAKSIVISGMARARFLDEARKRQLDLLVAVAGKSMFPFAAPNTSPQTIRANVTESGRLPSARGGAGPDYFIIGTGRVELYDDHAIFRPDGSPDVVSVTAPAGEDATAVVAPPPVTPPPVPVRPTRGSAAAARMFAQVNPTAAALTIIEALLSIALAVYLLVIGVLVLRDSRTGGKLHWIYVALKLPLVVGAIAANAWLWSGFAKTPLSPMATGAAPAGPTAMGGVVTFWVVLLGLVALAYPVAVIFVLLSRTARDYYRGTADY